MPDNLTEEQLAAIANYERQMATIRGNRNGFLDWVGGIPSRMSAPSGTPRRTGYGTLAGMAARGNMNPFPSQEAAARNGIAAATNPANYSGPMMQPPVLATNDQGPMGQPPQLTNGAPPPGLPPQITQPSQPSPPPPVPPVRPSPALTAYRAARSPAGGLGGPPAPPMPPERPLGLGEPPVNVWDQYNETGNPADFVRADRGVAPMTTASAAGPGHWLPSASRFADMIDRNSVVGKVMQMRNPTTRPDPQRPPDGLLPRLFGLFGQG